MYKKALLKPLFIALFDIKEEGWYKLSLRWGIFFLILTVGNEVVWRMFTQDTWVSYKFWSTIATTIFGLYQITLSKKYRTDRATKWGMRIDPFHLNGR
jgi:intracellular septation protein